MRKRRWKRAILILLVLHLPVIAAALFFSRQSSPTPAEAQQLVRPPQGSAAVSPLPITRTLPAPLPAAPQPPLVQLPAAMPPTPIPLTPTPLPPPAAQPVALTLPGREAEASGLAPTAPAAVPAADGLPSPRQQNAAAKEFIEGHWLGLEVIPLTPELAKEYRIPEGESGILVDEVTLEAAESGILAGDLVHAIESQLTPDLRQFFLATQTVRQRPQASVEVRRGGRTLSFTMRARNAPELGFAQMEAAQPILPGSISPHRTQNRPCTECHVIMTSGGQLPTDNGDILPTPGAISKNAIAPHRYRGSCDSCHRVLP